MDKQKFNKIIERLKNDDKSLKYCCICGNNISDIGAEAIIEAKKLYMHDNYISDEYMDFFKNYNEGK
jgi:hypothetical protein